MGFSRQEYWSGLLFSSPGDLPDPGMEPAFLTSLALAGSLFTTRAPWEDLPPNFPHQTPTFRPTSDQNSYQVSYFLSILPETLHTSERCCRAQVPWSYMGRAASAPLHFRGSPHSAEITLPHTGRLHSVAVTYSAQRVGHGVTNSAPAPGHRSLFQRRGSDEDSHSHSALLYTYL